MCYKLYLLTDKATNDFYVLFDKFNVLLMQFFEAQIRFFSRESALHFFCSANKLNMNSCDREPG